MNCKKEDKKRAEKKKNTAQVQMADSIDTGVKWK